jgi:predicted RNase H-like nuclease (RuvC/YqgF family)
MKRIAFMLAVLAVVAATAMAAAAQSDSLGDYARAVRKEKRPPAKMLYTNDNLPSTAAISVVGPPAASTEQNPAAKPSDEKPKADQKEGKTTENKTPQDEQGWRDQFAAQKRTIAGLEHELDLLQREYKLHVTEYYADAGNELRDQKKWAEDDAKYRADIAEKQKQIEEAKAQLQDMEEQARKAGVPSSASESPTPVSQ